MLSLFLALAIAQVEQPAPTPPDVKVSVESSANELYVGGLASLKIEVSPANTATKKVVVRAETVDRSGGQVFELKDGSYMVAAGALPGEIRVYVTAGIAYGNIINGSDRTRPQYTKIGVAMSDTVCKVIKVLPLPGPDPGPTPPPTPDPTPDPTPTPDSKFGLATIVIKDAAKISPEIRVTGAKALAKGFGTLKAKLVAGTILGKDEAEFWKNLSNTSLQLNEAELKAVKQTRSQWTILTTSIQAKLYELINSDKLNRTNASEAIEDIINGLNAVK